MSRGHGVTQRRILSHLADADGWVALITLAVPEGLCGDQRGWYASEIESTRRAVHRLVAGGLVETTTKYPEVYRPVYPSGSHEQLHVRLTAH